MIHNPTIDAMMSRRSVRKYKKERPSEEVIETVLQAGMQAPFASQLHSVLLSSKAKAPFGAPLWFTICVDLYKLERFMELRGWKRVTNDLTMLMFGVQDASYLAENMVIAAESLGLASCFLGEAPYLADRIAKEFRAAAPGHAPRGSRHGLPRRDRGPASPISPQVQPLRGQVRDPPPTRR